MLAALLLVGTLNLAPCHGDARYNCGSIVRPLDPAGNVPGTISIGFTWLQHSAPGPSAGTIVAAEGGPGYPSGESREGYREMLGPLLADHDLLMMDDRGTGRSGAIDCPPLQRSVTLATVTKCGAQLGATSDLYSSALAADDLDALMGALDVKSADFYGDSYGTFFVQVFAGRHPNRVTSVTLDGAYPPVGGDPWYPSTAPAIRSAFDAVCKRGTCPLGQTSMTRLDALLAALRRSGAPIKPWQLAFIMDTAGLDVLNYRDLDAAARAYLEDRDTVPLVRLARETEKYEEESSGTPPSEMSQGLFVAASCSDSPQAYDMTLPPIARQAAWQSALATKKRSDPWVYAPFTIDEFLGMPLDYSYVPLCPTWPVASSAHPAGQPFAPGTSMPDVPALVLTGDLDTITDMREGDAAAAGFRNVKRVIVPNGLHVTAVGDEYACSSVIVRNFMLRAPIDTSCTAHVPPVRTVGSFARRIDQMPRPVPETGRRWNDVALRKAASAVYAAADALAREEAFGLTNGYGLRGGTFSVTTTKRGAHRIALHGVKWTEDLAVNGTVTYDEKGNASASLQFPASAIHATWHGIAGFAYASITGGVGGDSVKSKLLVP